jgi:hypothetical protein
MEPLTELNTIMQNVAAYIAYCYSLLRFSSKLVEEVVIQALRKGEGFRGIYAI